MKIKDWFKKTLKRPLFWIIVAVYFLVLISRDSDPPSLSEPAYLIGYLVGSFVLVLIAWRIVSFAIQRLKK